MGLTIFLLTSLFIYQEATYEEDFSDNERIYQIGTSFYNMGPRAVTSVNVPMITSEIPEVKYTTIFTNRESQELYFEEKTFPDQRVISADSLFLKVFDFELLIGDPASILNEVNSVVVNEEVAMSLFGSTDIVGKDIRVGLNRIGIIKGISKTPKYKTQLDFDILISQARYKGPTERFWGSIGSYVYVKTTPNVTADQINDQLDRLNEKYIYSLYLPDGSMSFEEWLEADSYLGYFAESLDDLRYKSDTEISMMPKANLNQTNTLLIVGIAALLISIINFINITTAKASNRMKEVALKRIMGSSRLLLVIQFIFEAFLVVLLATILSLGLTELFVKLQPAMFGDFVEFSVLHSDKTVKAIVLLVVGLTLMSGLYPALYLSSGSMMVILRSGDSKNRFSVFNAGLLRKGATVLQFIFSIGLIGAVITMFMQIDFLRFRDLGYESSDVIVIPNSFFLKKNKATFKNELGRIPSIEKVAFTSMVPSDLDKWDTPLKLRKENGDWFYHYSISADKVLLEVLDLELVMGESFKETISKEVESNNEGQAVDIEEPNTGKVPVLVNQAALKALGIGEAPIGSIVDNYQIIGVVKDFVYTDLNRQVEPMVVIQKTNPGVRDPIVIKVSDEAAALVQIEKLWNSLAEKPLNYYRLSDNYDRLISDENASFNAVLTFSVFAVLVSCIGLFGLAVFTVDQRIKEFGIRKVLGASIKDIAVLFSTDFAKLIIIAFVIAMPFSIYFLDVWLSDFSARISIGYEVILLTGGLSMLIATTTILLQSLKAGRLNPVETLRSE